MSLHRIRAVLRKELRDIRRNRFIVTTMSVMPLVFLISPTVTLFRVPASAAASLVDRSVGGMSLLMFVVPVVIPPVIAAYSVIGERDLGTLEPLLTTPVRRKEIVLGKALAAFLPSVSVAYAVYAIELLIIRLGAAHVVSAVVWHVPEMLTQILFTPLLAVWAIWVGIAMSVRARDIRVAQQLATLASLPALGLASIFALRVVVPNVPIVVGLGLGLLAVDLAGWRLVSGLFDRERLITGARGVRAA
jgi:ABC-type Na+ efflux pump permease subunit